MANELTASDVHQLLLYNPDTGEFRWRVNRRGGAKAGAVAGCLRPDNYIYVGLKGKHYLAHRIAWLLTYGNWPTKQIDHVNCDKADNRISNLREASHSENQRNTPRLRTNTSGFKGVSWNNHNKKWQAQIWAGGRHRHLGYFETAEAGYESYCAAAKEHHGHFARFD